MNREQSQNATKGRFRTTKSGLTLEPLEERALLAGDCGVTPVMATVFAASDVPGTEAVETDVQTSNDAGTEFAERTILDLEEADDLASLDSDSAGALNFSASDAGSSRSSAQNLGVIVGQQTLPGSLSYFDRLDVFRFDVQTESATNLSLTGMWGDADLLLADSNGRIFASSTNSGNSNESLSADLLPGAYYVAAQARSFWGTSYRLNFDVTAATPPAESVPPNTSPTADQPPGASTPSSPPPGNQVVEPLADAPYFGSQQDWNLNSINAPEAWQAGYTGQGVTVAIVDTGVDLDHPDLVTNLFVNPGEIPGNGLDDDQNGYVDDVHGYDFVDRDANPNDGNGHGTHVAGSVAAANNGVGATGVAPDAKILPVRVLGDNGSGSTRSVADGIRYAADLGAQVINLSLGGGYSQAVAAAINYANSLGSIVIAAAGNEGASVPSYPARLSSGYNNVLSVGAFNSSSQIAGFSNRVGSSNASQVDAPGVSVYSTYLNGSYSRLSGTSMASPHVAGVAALALSANPSLSPSTLREYLQTGTTSQARGSDAVGIVNAATTVAYAIAGTTGTGVGATNNASFQGSANASQTNARMLPGLATPPVERPKASSLRSSFGSTNASVEIDSLYSLATASELDPHSLAEPTSLQTRDVGVRDRIFAEEMLSEFTEAEESSLHQIAAQFETPGVERIG
ncbi:MAG: S8 family serine peptidase [Aureliella sp.]